MKGELLSRLCRRGEIKGNILNLVHGGNEVEAEAFDNRCACIFQLLRVPTFPYTASAPEF